MSLTLKLPQIMGGQKKLKSKAGAIKSCQERKIAAPLNEWCNIQFEKYSSQIGVIFYFENINMEYFRNYYVIILMTN